MHFVYTRFTKMNEKKAIFANFPFEDCLLFAIKNTLFWFESSETDLVVEDW